MVVPTSWLDGYRIETTFGTSLITGAAETAYKLGLFGDKEPLEHPSPTANLVYAPTALNSMVVAAGRVWVQSFTAAGNYTFGVQNGVALALALGESITTIDTPAAGYNTHAIAPRAAVAGSVPSLHSFTWHHEKHMSDASVWSLQFTGCKAASLNLICERERKYLLAQMGVLSKSRAKVAFNLTNAPALPATANATPFNYRDMVVTYDTGGTPTNISEYCTGVQLEVKAGLEAIGENRAVDPAFFGEAWRHEYKLTLDIIPYASTIHDDFIARTLTKDMTIKWSRNSTYDYILATLTDIAWTAFTVSTPEHGEEEIAHVIGEPRTVTFSVVDKLAGSAYGE